MLRKLLLLSLFVCSLLGFAQPIDWNKTLPMDPNVVIGKLPNGITYYLRHNEEPKERASFYIIRNAGALLENDDQNGLAHFLEHMAFNGSKNFPGNSMISTLEKHGISFGGNLNAYTSQNETVYNISDVPVKNESLIDTCLLILHDWSYYLTLDPKEIDEERGVITEEWRTRNTSSSRMLQQRMDVMFKGSQYAKRDVIGSMEVISSFKPETIKNFYHQWYRTDLEAIAIAGDFDVKAMEAKIKKVFSSIPAVKNPTPRPFFEIPSHEETYFCLSTDKEATSSTVQVIRVFPEKEYDGKYAVTLKDIKNSLIQSFYNNMVSYRIYEMIQRGQAPFLSASISFGGITRGYYCYSIYATAKPNKEREALTAILQEHERIWQHGFNEQELDRVKTNTLTSLESMLKDKDKVDNEQYVSEMQAHFLTKEGIITIEDYVAAVREILPLITAKEVSEQVKRWWKKDNRTIIVSGPSEGVTHLSEPEAREILASAETLKVAPYQDNSVNGKLIEEDLKGSPVTSVKAIPELGAEEWTLGNGAKVVYRKADFEKDQVALYAYSPGGSSLYEDVNLLPAASNTGSYANAYGISKFDNIALNKLLTGKQANCGVSISGLYESVNGYAIPKDFETMMQILYLRFQQPRFDTLAHRVLIDRSRIQVKQMAGKPQTIIKDSLSQISSNYSPRVQLFNDAYLDKLTIENIEKIYKDRICDASDFTFFIVGNVEKETAKEMAQKYIGSIPSLYRKEKWIDRKTRGPKGRVEKVINIPLEVPKSTVYLTFSKEMKYTIKESTTIRILANILTNRYIKTIREEQGGTYGVGVSGSAYYEPYSCYNMFMTFDCDPEKATELKPLLYKEVDHIIQEGITQEELDKVVKNTLKETEQNKAHNSYWMSMLTTYYKTGVNMDDPKNYENILSEMTVKDVQKFAKKFFKKANVVDIIFAPKSK